MIRASAWWLPKQARKPRASGDDPTPVMEEEIVVK